MDECRWYVSETLPQSETLAQANLSRQGFESFCPRMRKLRRHARRSDVVLVPIFPGYLFVRFNRERDPWRSINGTLGIRRLVGPNPIKPQPVPEEVMDLLFERCEPGTAQLRSTMLQPGDSVRFLTGPLSDRIAQVEHMESGGRVNLLLEILGGARRIVSSSSDLVPV